MPSNNGSSISSSSSSELFDEERKCIINAAEGNSNWKDDGDNNKTLSSYSSIMILPTDTIPDTNDCIVVATDTDTNTDDINERYWPSSPHLLYHASYIAIFDILAQSLVYTGNNYAGPTIFAIIYSD
jgi:hypothetical protein